MPVHIRFDVSPTEGLPEVIVGHATFVNQGDGPIAVLPIQMDSASLALEIRDGGGDPVGLPPPPVPNPEARPIELTPGAVYEVEYPGFMPQWTEPGRYQARARLVGADAHSDWVGLVVIDGPTGIGR